MNRGRMLNSSSKVQPNLDNHMKTSLTILLLVVAANFSIAQSTSREEQAVLDLSRKKFDWLINKQYDSLTKLMDDRMQYLHSNGWTENKKEVVEDIRSGKLNYQKVTIKEASARVYPATAIVIGVGTFEGVNDGKPFSLELRYTEVYIKSGNQWRLASRHANRMP